MASSHDYQSVHCVAFLTLPSNIFNRVGLPMLSSCVAKRGEDSYRGQALRPPRRNGVKAAVPDSQTIHPPIRGSPDRVMPRMGWGALPSLALASARAFSICSRAGRITPPVATSPRAL